jgi:hypothetical protein
MPFLLTFVPEALKSRVHSISVQHIVRTYAEWGGLDWLEEFQRKYGLD